MIAIPLLSSADEFVCSGEMISRTECYISYAMDNKNRIDNLANEFEKAKEIKIVNYGGFIPYKKDTPNTKLVKIAKPSAKLVAMAQPLIIEARQLMLWQLIKHEQSGVILFEFDTGGSSESSPILNVLMSKGKYLKNNKTCPISLDDFYGRCSSELFGAWYLNIFRKKPIEITHDLFGNKIPQSPQKTDLVKKDKH